MTTSATKDATVWVYRCSVYAYPWYTSVRTILDDPAYSDWFVKFKKDGPCAATSTSFLDPFFAHFSAPPHPARAARRVLLGAVVCLVPMPIRGGLVLAIR